MKTILILLFLLHIGCFHQPKNQSQPSGTQSTSIEAKQLAAEEEAHAVTEISFKHGSSRLNPQSQEQLKDLLNRVTANQIIDEIKVITWADEEYPDEEQANLSQGQQILVRQRNSKIRNFLRTLRKDLNFEMISMAERPSKLSEIWGDADARMKKSLEAAGISIQGTKTKGISKASRSIVMLVLDR